MNIFIVGDIHGCYYTFKTMLNRYWDDKKDLLIQVGDFIDRGNNTPQTVKLCKELQHQYDAIFLKGNHEYMAIKHFFGKGHDKWFQKYGKSVLWQYHLEGIEFNEDLIWMNKLPTIWENDYLFITHAGRSNSANYLNEDDPESILWNKSLIKKINKVQVFGHSPQIVKKPEFNGELNCWNIDTGAYLGNYLSAVKFDEKGNFIDVFSVSTSMKDIA